GALPLGFRGETLSFPGAEGGAVVPTHVDHRPLFHSRGDLAVAPLVGWLMASRLHKRSIALVRDFGLVHIEWRDRDRAHGQVVFERIRVPDQLGIGPVISAAAGKIAAGNKDHAWLGGHERNAAEQEEGSSRKCSTVHPWG